MNELSKCYIGIDLGGTKTLVASFSPTGDLINRKMEKTPQSLEKCLNLINSFTHELSQNKSIIGIGVSAGGPLDPKKGEVSSLHLPEWENVPLKQILEKKYNCPCVIEVDTDAAAFAENLLGNNNSNRLLYITISTGLGGGFIVDGEIYRGVNGAHPEIGHQIIPLLPEDQKDVICSCGSLNCLESLVSGTAIKKRYGVTAEFLPEERWLNIYTYLAHGIRNLTHIYTPELVIMGGGISISRGNDMISKVSKLVLNNTHIVPFPKIILSNLGYEASLWGSYAIIKNYIENLNQTNKS